MSQVQLKYGVSNYIWQQILQVCFKFPQVKQVILYGSRANNTYREGSDIDLAIDAPKMTEREFSLLWNAIDDLPIIFSFDIVHLQRLENEELIKAIKKNGVSLTLN